MTHNDVRSEPGSRLVVGRILLLKKKVAMYAGQTDDVTNGCFRRVPRARPACFISVTSTVKLLEG